MLLDWEANDSCQFFLNHTLTRNVTFTHETILRAAAETCSLWIQTIVFNCSGGVVVSLPAATFMCVLIQTDDALTLSRTDAGVWGKVGEECVWYLALSE